MAPPQREPGERIDALRSHRRIQELVLCDLLRRHHDSALARARQRPA